MNSILLTLAICATLAVALPEGKHFGRPVLAPSHFAHFQLDHGSKSSEEVKPGEPVKPVKPNRPFKPFRPNTSFLTKEQCLTVCSINQELASTLRCVCNGGGGDDAASPADTTVSGITSDAITDVSTDAASDTTVSGIASDTITDVSTDAPTQTS